MGGEPRAIFPISRTEHNRRCELGSCIAGIVNAATRPPNQSGSSLQECRRELAQYLRDITPGGKCYEAGEATDYTTYHPEPNDFTKREEECTYSYAPFIEALMTGDPETLEIMLNGARIDGRPAQYDDWVPADKGDVAAETIFQHTCFTGSLALVKRLDEGTAMQLEVTGL